MSTLAPFPRLPHARRALAAGLLAGACALAAPVLAQASAGGCHPPVGAHVALRVSGGLIFETSPPEAAELCSEETGRAVYISSLEHYGWPLAAFDGIWGAVYVTARAVPAALELFDMSSGRRRFSYPLGDEVAAIVIAPDGAIAWIEDDGGDLEPEASAHVLYELREHNHYGTFLLDRSHAIAPHSLVRSGARLSWRDRGSRRSAPLR